jgi:hypothetical protein
MTALLFDGDDDDRSIPLSILEILLWVSSPFARHPSFPSMPDVYL